MYINFFDHKNAYITTMLFVSNIAFTIMMLIYKFNAYGINFKYNLTNYLLL